MEPNITKISSAAGKPVNWKVNLISLWISQLFVMGGFSAMIPFIPLFLKYQLGISGHGELAFYVSMFNFFGTLGYAISTPIWGMLSDKFGVRPMLLRGTFGSAVFFVMMAYSTSPTMLIALRFFSSVFAGTTSASQMMLARTTPDNHQGMAFGLLLSAVWGGSAVGNVIGGFIIHYFSYMYAFWFCGILYVLAGFAVLPTRDNKAICNNGGKKTIKSHRVIGFTLAVWAMLGLAVLLGLTRSIEVPYVALQIEKLTSAEKAAYWTGIINAVVCVGAISAGVVFGILVDKCSQFKLLAIIMPIATIALFLQGLVHSLFYFTMFRVLLFVVSAGIAPLLQKTLTAAVPRRKRGAAFGFYSSCGSLGTMIAALVGGWSSYALGLSGVFFVAALSNLVAWSIFHYGIKFVTDQPFYNRDK